jgi:hypothetical protein
MNLNYRIARRFAQVIGNILKKATPQKRKALEHDLKVRESS